MQQTYESRQAKRQVDNQPDKIHWDERLSFRDVAYRQLHHQNGVIGIFTIRLLEACDLKRSYWSPLALGPVKHLGLSKAHGAVTSYCTVSLGYHMPPRPRYVVQTAPTSTPATVSASSSSSFSSKDDGTSSGGRDSDYMDSKPAAIVSCNALSSSNIPVWDEFSESKSSPVVECNNNPVWDNCTFDLPLRKGYGGTLDGMCVHLNVRVDEEGTYVDTLVPGFIPLGGNNSQNRCLGYGQIDLTELLFGESLIDGTTLPSIRDEWVPITLLNTSDSNQQEAAVGATLNELNMFDEQQCYKNDPLSPPKTENSSNNNKNEFADAITGMVRVLISYQPNGYEPENNDVVALETFARRDPMYTSCIPILPPLQPLTVIDRRGPYVLCEYSLPNSISNSQSLKRHTTHINDGQYQQQTAKILKAQVRLHRNTIFVIERQSMIDAAHNLLLLPIDAALSTPLGQTAQMAMAPIIAASSELFMPTILSLKLLWMATRATAMASVSGVSALTGTLLREGANSLINNKNNGPQSQPTNASSNNQQRRDAQFVQL